MDNLGAEVVDRDHELVRSIESQPSKKIRLSKIGNLVKKFWKLRGLEGKINRSEKREEKILKKIEGLRNFDENANDQVSDIVNIKISKLNIKLKDVKRRTEVLYAKQSKRIKMKDRALGRLKYVCSVVGNKLSKFGENNIEDQENTVNHISDDSSLNQNNGIDLSNDINQANISDFVNEGFNDASGLDNSTGDNLNSDDEPSIDVEGNDSPIESNAEGDIDMDKSTEDSEEVSLNEVASDSIDVNSFFDDAVEENNTENQENMENSDTQTSESYTNTDRENVIVTPTVQKPVNIMNDNAAYNMGVADIIGYKAMEETMNNNTYRNPLNFELSRKDLKKEAANAAKRDADRREEELDNEANALMSKLGIDLNLLTDEEKQSTFEICKKRIVAKRVKDQIMAQEAQETENLRIAKEQTLNQIYNKINSVIDQDKSDTELAQQRAETTREQAEKISKVAEMDLETMLGADNVANSNAESKGSK